jgi:hypothetical protein
MVKNLANRMSIALAVLSASLASLAHGQDMPEVGAYCRTLGAQALGLELTIYDPDLTLTDHAPLGLVSLLENILLGVRSLNGRAA